MTEINEPASLADRLEDINHITQFDGLDALVATCTQAAAALRAMEEALAERDALKAEVERTSNQKPSDADTCLRLINELRADYGTVTILPDNEEAVMKAEQMAIDCCGEWTGWVDVRFYGENLVQCLAKAITARAASAEAKLALEPRP